MISPSAPMHEPVPKRFLDLILPGEGGEVSLSEVLPFRVRRLVPVLGGVGLAVAAALTAVVVLLPQSEPRLVAGAVEPSDALGRILDNQPSGVPIAFGEGEIIVLASFPAASGFCREVEWLEPNALNLALACQKNGGWTVDVVMAETLDRAPEGPGFAPASGEVATTLEPWLTAREVGVALTPAQEAAAIGAGWQN